MGYALKVVGLKLRTKSELHCCGNFDLSRVESVECMSGFTS